jgi:hypothetical protein
MSLSVDQINVRVVIPGAGRIVDNQYLGDGSTTFAKGDLVRVTTSGQIKDAATDSDTTGPCHGMVLDNWATAPTTSQFVPIFQFASDTELEGQLYAAAAGDSEPRDVAIGTSVTLRNSAAGKWCPTVTTTKGIALITAKTANVKWFEDALDDDYGLIRFRFTQANLDGHAS